MVNNKLEIKIISKDEDGKVKFSDFISELNTVSHILNRLDHNISHSENTSMYYRIVTLKYTSPATVEIEAIPKKPAQDYTRAVVGRFLEDLDYIKKGIMPKEFDRDLLNSYKTLTNPINNGITQIDFKSNDYYVDLVEDLGEKVKEILGEDEILHGSITGNLDSINAHGQDKKFYIYPIAGANKIECYFPDSLKGKAKEGLFRYVNVIGRIHYKSKEKFPHAIDVEDIEIYPEEKELPSWFDLRGIAPDCTGKLSSEEFIANIRYGA